MSKKFKIGIPVWEVGPNTLGVSKSYIGFVKRFGRIIYLDPDHEIRDDLDGILLPGGSDVDTKRYNQAPGLYTGKPDVYKEWFDYKYLQEYIKLGVPIFCTCRGMQSMWVHLGGSLHQDLGENLWIYDHKTNPSDDPYSEMHKATVEKKWLEKLNFNKNIFGVNSRHHQVVDDNTTPEDVTIISRHPKDKTVEAFIHNKYPIVAFQSHIEDCYTPFGENLFEFILETKQSVYKLKE